jgi:hypothetical protein
MDRLKKPKDFLEKLRLTDSDYQDSGMINHIADLLERYSTEQLDLHGVSKRTLKRICEHEDCNKEFTLELNLFGDKSKANIAMMECPHCNKRNDLWLELS